MLIHSALLVVVLSNPTRIENVPDKLNFFQGAHYKGVEKPRDRDPQALGDFWCQKFYTERGVDTSEIFNEYVTQGGQGQVSRCFTTKTGVYPEETAQKIYFYGETATDALRTVNEAVNATGVRPILYMFHDDGYIEQWLGDYRNLQEPRKHPNLLDVATEAAQRLAIVHATDADVDHEQHLKPGRGWWNTRRVTEHFWVLEHLTSDQDRFNEMIAWFGWDRQEYEANVQWVESLITSTHPVDEPAFLCHNDPHGGNMMVREDDPIGDSLQLIDYDGTSYGYRAFDWSYYTTWCTTYQYWLSLGTNGGFLDDKIIDEFFTEYQKYSNDSTTQLMYEYTNHLPYVLLEQQFFLYGQIGWDNFLKPLICEYERLQRLHGYPRPINCERLLNDKPRNPEAFSKLNEFFN